MISFPYGPQQDFRYHHRDVNVLVILDPEQTYRHTTWRLNDGAPAHFYVEPDVPIAIGHYAWNTNSPSVFRLQGRPGWGNIEIPTDDDALQSGQNRLTVDVETTAGSTATATVEFCWNPEPVHLPLDLSDLSNAADVQAVGQAVNGLFEIDPASNVVRSIEPIGADVLLLLGSPAGSQEATYDVRFSTDGRTGTYIGLSDFFVGHSEQEASLGIKPGYSTAGLATVSPGGWAQMWMALGDCLVDKPWAWLERSRYPARSQIRAGTTYRVRHQCVIDPEVNLTRFRIWPANQTEPTSWLCVEDNAALSTGLERHAAASFGLFQFGGHPTEWSNIRVSELVVSDDMIADALARPRHRTSGSINKIRKAIEDRARWRADELRSRLENRNLRNQINSP